MDEAMNNGQAQTCPRCGNHCPADALQCGKGRKYFGVTDEGHGHDHGHGHGHKHGHSHSKDGLAGLLHQCGRFVRHSELEESELFQALTDEEKAALQTLLEKLAASWKERCGEEGFSRHGHHDHDGKKHHHKHGGHDK